ncbi:hypothetical protein AB0M95_31235 [Sphaerisporangium sp. NPDC051017]|uniref:hypothetical protein n=1 Tax=Sphaerisporangium sp. NPDC051017 TaxID=3154636 RepID=UPI003421D852
MNSELRTEMYMLAGAILTFLYAPAGLIVNVYVLVTGLRERRWVLMGIASVLTIVALMYVVFPFTMSTRVTVRPGS